MKKTYSNSLCAAAASLIAASLFAVTTTAQAPPPPPHVIPAPTNLKVLPKTMTGEQVHDLMHTWEAALGTNCEHCHTPDPKNLAPNGKPRMNFADDSKTEKATARLMYRMTEDINVNYVSMVENSGEPVTCGTCHRGKLAPEPFVAPKEHEHEHNDHHHAKPPLPR